jgi:peptidyl-prolyl cis-trans isomerase D
VSPVFELDDQFVVAVLNGKAEKDDTNIEARREELTAAVRNEEKAKKDHGKTEWPERFS